MAVFCAVERASEAVGRRDAAALRCHGERTGGLGALLGMRSVRAGEVKASSAAHAAALAPREAAAACRLPSQLQKLEHLCFRDMNIRQADAAAMSD